MQRLHLHKSSRYVGLLVGTILVLITVPGRIVDGEPSTWMTFDHGWPFTYLRRQTEGNAPAPQFVQYRPWHDEIYQRAMLGIPWLVPDNWQFWEASVDPSDFGHESARREFSLQWLLIDLIVSALLLVLVITAWELRRRKRPGPFAIKLTDVLVATTVISLLLGYAVYLKKEYKQETLLIETALDRSIFEASRDSWSMRDDVCVAPTWVSALFGERLLPEFMWRACDVEIDMEDGADLEAICKEVSRLRYVTTVWIASTTRKPFRYSTLRCIDRMETMVLGPWFEGPLQSGEVAELLTLTRLQKLVVEDLAEQIDPSLLSRLSTELPDCAIIDIYQDW